MIPRYTLQHCWNTPRSLVSSCYSIRTNARCIIRNAHSVSVSTTAAGSHREQNMRVLRKAFCMSALVTSSSAWILTRRTAERYLGDTSARRFVATVSLQGSHKRHEDDTDDADFAMATATVTTEFATSYHAPVMWNECVEALLSSPRSKNRGISTTTTTDDRTPLLFIDGTLGGGGHSAALLQRLQPGDVVFGCDVDPAALATASERLQEYLQVSDTKPLFIPVQANFASLAAKLPTICYPHTAPPSTTNNSTGNDATTNLVLPPTCPGVDGILLDLGVSSHQIDTAERGFAFMKDGPLDMRMGQQNLHTGLTAADICNEFDEVELRRILKTYGDEPRAKSIAHSIVQSRPLQSTNDLVEAVSAVVPQFARKGKRLGRMSTLARVFQSLRIVVNQEDKVLEQALVDMAPTLLRPGGRLVVLSYQSMEDRSTKRVMRDGMTRKKTHSDEKDMYGNYCGAPRPFLALGKRQKATEEEITGNPRARSATLRVAERQDTGKAKV